MTMPPPCGVITDTAEFMPCNTRFTFVRIMASKFSWSMSSIRVGVVKVRRVVNAHVQKVMNAGGNRDKAFDLRRAGVVDPHHRVHPVHAR